MKNTVAPVSYTDEETIRELAGEFLCIHSFSEPFYTPFSCAGFNELQMDNRMPKMVYDSCIASRYDC